MSGGPRPGTPVKPPKRPDGHRPPPGGRRKDGSPRRPPRRAPNQLTSEQYHEIAKAYFETPTYDAVSKKTGFAIKSIKRYVERGDPSRGLQPIGDRYRTAQINAQRKADAKWEDKAAEWKVMFGGMKGLIASALQEVGKDPAKRDAFLQKLFNDPHFLATTMKNVMREEHFLFGGADQRIVVEMQVKQLVSEFGISEDEARQELARAAVLREQAKAISG